MKTQSDETKDLLVALNKAKKQFSNINKEKVNPHFKNRYAGLDDILAAVSDPLIDNGLNISWHFLENDRLLVQLKHIESGQYMASAPKLINKKGDDQGQGSSTTYCVRYAIQGLLGIVADDDDDGNSTRQVKPGKKPATTEQLKKCREIVDEMASAGDNVSKYTKEWAMSLSWDDADHFIRNFS